MNTECFYTKFAINGYQFSSEITDSVEKLFWQMKSKNLLMFGNHPVYKININVKENVHNANFYRNVQSEYEIFTASDIKTDEQICQSVRKEYDKIQHMPDVLGVPAILTKVSDVYHGFGILQRRPIYGVKRTVAGKDIEWHILNPDSDIVIDKNLNQIYPEKTGAMPMILQELLQRTK